MTVTPGTDSEKVSSGTPGLDTVLNGGFLAGHTAIVTGGPGSGKTVLALQFLAATDGDALYIGFEEREATLRQNAERLGIDLSNVTVLDLSAGADRFFDDEQYTLFSSEEVEGEELLERIAVAIESHDIDRLVIDPLSELRTLLPDEFQFRRNISSLLNALNDRDITTVCTSQRGTESVDRDLQYLGTTTIELHRTTERRVLEVTKYRGSAAATGRHTYRIHAGTGGHVYPKLVPGDHFRETTREPCPSGIPELDAMLDGGLERGSVTIVTGPSGVGKTTMSSYFLQQAADSGDRAIAFLFEELESDYLYRASNLEMDLSDLVDDGVFEIEEVESLTQSPDEFAHAVQQAVEARDAQFVLIDGIAGYRLGLLGDDSQEQLTREVHALCRYLKRMGVTTIIVEETSGKPANFQPTRNRTSYIADTVVALQYLEVDAGIDRVVGVMKKRYSGFDQSLRKLWIDGAGLHVGETLSGYRGILTGVPERVDGAE